MRVTVLRAREIPLDGQTSVSEIVQRILTKIMSGVDPASFQFDIQDITSSAVMNNSKTVRRRGTALLIFRGPVPESLQALIQGADGRIPPGSYDSVEPSMDIDANFIGITQLYGPRSEDEIVAEFVIAFFHNPLPYVLEHLSLHRLFTASSPSMDSTVIHTGVGSASRIRACGCVTFSPRTHLSVESSSMDTNPTSLTLQ